MRLLESLTSDNLNPSPSVLTNSHPPLSFPNISLSLWHTTTQTSRSGEQMGNRYNNHMHRQHLHQRTTFLPMLCSRTSIKDVHRRRPPNPSSSSSSHPSSPKVTCMGQVNRSNRVTGYPTAATAATAAATPIKYHKLIRLFSGKTPTATTTTGRSAEKMIVGRSLSERQMGYRDLSESYAAVNVAELDPPLPVVKRRQQPAAADGNLWKRRSGGCELESLQLQHIQLPNKRCVLQPITTV